MPEPGNNNASASPPTSDRTIIGRAERPVLGASAIPDGDRTVLSGPPSDRADAFESGNALPVGTRLGEFEIKGLVGEGGFGIVYRAYDHNLDRQVALKEYLPSSLAARQIDTTVKVKSSRHEETFAVGLRSFVNEARLLAQFDHPSLVKVFRFWEQHGTAYMVMPLYEGQTLKQALRNRDTPPDERWLRSILDPLLDALELIHHTNCFHRDIAPDNILLLADGRPVLLDFGAARRVIGDMTQALTVILKPGYAPIEQYDEIAHLRQGAWTDLYALAAVIHCAIRGKPPPAAVGRSVKDTYQPLSEVVTGRYSARFLAAIDRALSPLPDQRPQSVAEFRQLLGPAPLTSAARRSPAPGERLETGGRTARVQIVGGILTAVLVAAGAGYFLMRDRGAQTPEALGESKSAGGQGADETRKIEPPPTQAPPPEFPKPAPKLKPFDPLVILSGLLQASDPSHVVHAEPTRKTVRIGKDQVQFRVRSSQGGYVYVLLVGTEHENFNLLFPNKLDQDNRISANRELALPRSSWSLVAQGPAGANTFLVIVAPTPRDFSGAGLKSLDVFAEFDRAEAERVFRDANGSPAPFAGTSKCAAEVTDCPEAYGAALFRIEEVRN